MDGLRHWQTEALTRAIGALLPGFAAEAVAEVDSTSTELMRRARAGQLAPTLLVAERQTAGRGRLGRSWHSEAVDADVRELPSLTFSLALPLAPADWSGLSLAVGVAVAESLHERVGLKWPNDLWLKGEDRKLGGILIETANVGERRHAVIGIGINIAPRPAAGLATPPAALQELLPGIDAPAALARIALPLARALLAFQGLGFAPFQARFAARDVLAGRALTLSDGGTGTGRGVSPTGALQVGLEDGGLRPVSSAEVSVRPVASAQAA